MRDRRGGLRRGGRAGARLGRRVLAAFHPVVAVSPRLAGCQRVLTDRAGRRCKRDAAGHPSPGARARAERAVAPVETAPIEMKGPVPTAMADALRDLGLDPKKLPPMEKLEPRALRGAMKLLAKSLGAKCVDSHTEGDFAAPTRRKKIAAHMWDDFAARLSMADGSPLFCDSCHQGRIRQLDRRDKKALAGWMDQNFVAKLAGSGARPVECETCHVDMEMLFLAKWGGSPPAR